MQPVDSNIVKLWAAVSAAAMGSYSLGFAVRLLLRSLQVLDKPNERSSHSELTPRGGGLGVMVVFLIGAGCITWLTESRLSLVVIIITSLLATISFVDDRRPLPWWSRLGTHLVAALAVTVVMLSDVGLDKIWLGACLVLLFAGYANAFNFMDGINGLAAGQAVVSAAGMAAIAVVAGMPPRHPAVLLCVLLTAATAGFLPHNFPRARMFMGDVGSVPLGFLLMLLTAWIARDGGWWLLMPLGTLHSGFILDTGITLLRRAVRGEKLHEAHREHFYQRLIRSGWSHQAVTGIQMGVTLSVLAAMLIVTDVRRDLLPLAVAGVLMGWLVYFVFCEWEFSRREQ